MASLCHEPHFSVLIALSSKSFGLAWGLIVGLPGFASHGRSLHLGAGCQWWKLLDVSGTQPPISDAVVNRSCFVQVRRSRLILWDLGGTFSMTSARFVSARKSAEPNFNWGKKGGGRGLKTGNGAASLDGGLRLKPGSLLFFLFYSSYAPQSKTK